MSALTSRLRRRTALRDALRALRVASAQADETYRRWAVEPTRERYREYLGAEAAVHRARQRLHGCESPRRPEASAAPRRRR